MGSSHCGELGLGKGRRSGASRRGVKRSGSMPEKPRQPQRGLGVAQLEKIRLCNQIMGGYLPSFQPPFPCSNLHKVKEEGLRVEMAFSLSRSSDPYSCSATMVNSSSYGLLPNFTMGYGANNRSDIRYGECLQSTATPRSLRNHHEYYISPPRYEQLPVTLTLFEQQKEKRYYDRWHSTDSIMQMSDSSSSSSEELDLDLKLSL